MPLPSKFFYTGGTFSVALSALCFCQRLARPSDRGCNPFQSSPLSRRGVPSARRAPLSNLWSVFSHSLFSSIHVPGMIVIAAADLSHRPSLGPRDSWPDASTQFLRSWHLPFHSLQPRLRFVNTHCLNCSAFYRLVSAGSMAWSSTGPVWQFAAASSGSPVACARCVGCGSCLVESNL